MGRLVVLLGKSDYLTSTATAWINLPTIWIHALCTVYTESGQGYCLKGFNILFSRNFNFKFWVEMHILCTSSEASILVKFTTGRARSSEWSGNEPLIEFQAEASFGQVEVFSFGYQSLIVMEILKKVIVRFQKWGRFEWKKKSGADLRWAAIKGWLASQLVADGMCWLPAITPNQWTRNLRTPITPNRAVDQKFEVT